MKKRQKTRKGIILFSFFLFPASFFYFSPVLIIQATTENIINGSFIMFFLMFISSLFLGRAFCGWLCPAGGCQEAISLSREKRVTKGNYIKWFIWVLWISAIIILSIKNSGYKKIDFFYQTEYGLSIGNVAALITYYCVLLILIAIPALLFGKRSFCHHLCWMAPFMIAGRKIRNKFNWPSLQLKSEAEKCKHCHKCTKTCPMSLPVEDMVNQKKLDNLECILCGMCIDGCPSNTINFAFRDTK